HIIADRSSLVQPESTPTDGSDWRDPTQIMGSRFLPGALVTMRTPGTVYARRAGARTKRNERWHGKGHSDRCEHRSGRRDGSLAARASDARAGGARPGAAPYPWGLGAVVDPARPHRSARATGEYASGGTGP